MLWANRLLDGVVVSDRSDKQALCRFSDKLDTLCAECGVMRFSDTHDTTDARCNLGTLELPEGMQSTDELMAAQGVWVDAGDALRMLEALLARIRDGKIRFGLLGNAHDRVVRELEESIAFARELQALSARFNFAVVT